MAESLLGVLEIFFSNDVNVKIRTDSLLDDFRSNCVVFLLLPDLDGGSKLGSRVIYNVPELFFLKHGLDEISPLGSIFKALKLLFFFAVITLDSHLEQERGRVKRDAYIRYTERVS